MIQIPMPGHLFHEIISQAIQLHDDQVSKLTAEKDRLREALLSCQRLSQQACDDVPLKGGRLYSNGSTKLADISLQILPLQMFHEEEPAGLSDLKLLASAPLGDHTQADVVNGHVPQRGEKAQIDRIQDWPPIHLGSHLHIQSGLPSGYVECSGLPSAHPIDSTRKEIDIYLKDCDFAAQPEMPRVASTMSGLSSKTHLASCPAVPVECTTLGITMRQAPQAYSSACIRKSLQSTESESLATSAPTAVTEKIEHSESSKKIEHTSTLNLEILSAAIMKHHEACRASTTWIFFEDKHSSCAAKAYHNARYIFIQLACLLAFMQVLESGSGSIELFRSEMVSEFVQCGIEVVFCMEWIARFLFCPNKLLFCMDTYNVIDAVSVLPLAVRIPIMASTGKGTNASSSPAVVSFIALVPVFRLLKGLRRFRSFQLLLTAIRAAVEALPVILFILALLILTFAAIIYYLEPREVIPEVPSALYFVIVSLSTVGYGDITPQTWGGKCLACFIMISGPLYTAIPIGIVGHSFSRIWEDRQRLFVLQKMRIAISTAGYSMQEVAEFFALLDKDGNQTLDIEEFRRLLHAMDICVPCHLLNTVFDMLDEDGSGGLTFREFLVALFPSSHWLLHDAGRSSTDAGCQRESDRITRVASSPLNPSGRKGKIVRTTMEADCIADGVSTEF